MAKTFNLPEPGLITGDKRTNTRTNRSIRHNEKRFNGLIHTLRNVDPRSLNYFDILDVTQESVAYR